MQPRGLKLFHRVMLLLAIIITLAIASTRLQADTLTCSFAMVTLPFTDVPSSNPFFCAIAEAYFSALSNGTTSTTYSPSTSVPREQMAAFVTRTLDQSLKRGSQRAELGKWWRDDSRTYTAGGIPKGIKSDGQDLWVAIAVPGIVQRVRASDGKILETWTGAANPDQVLVARGYVFITSAGSPGRIYRIDPSLPAGPVTTITSTIPGVPNGITTDGRRLWITHSMGVSILLMDGAIVSTVSADLVFPIGVIFDGTSIWVTDQGDGKMKKLDVNGSVVQAVAVGNSPGYPVFDGTNIWVPNGSSQTVTVVRAATGAVLATLSDNELNLPLAAAFDGERILVTNGNALKPSMWKATDFSPIPIPDGRGQQSFACSDGVNFWMTLVIGGELWRY